MNHMPDPSRAFVRPDDATVAKVKEELAKRFGNRLVTSQAVREQHANHLTWQKNEAPDAVVFAQDTQDCVEIIKLCAEYRMPVIPYGTGTSLEGHINAPFGGVSVDLSQMNKVIAVHAEDLDCVIEPGVTREDLNAHVRNEGLFFPIDPGANASLGGMTATRASGTNAVRYGTMKDNVLSLKAVLASGEVVTTATRAKKSSSGYDLTRLFVGSEGTLGLMTEITLRLQGIPEAIAAGVCPFPTVKAACEATIMTIQMGIPVARIELLDEFSVKCVNLHSKLDLPETPVLFLEFHGTEAGVKEQSERFDEIATELGGGPFEWATKPEDRTKLWKARHNIYWAGFAVRPGAATFATDVCVPISRLADCVTAARRDIAELGITAGIVGHVGDGNFHASPLFDLDDEDEVGRVKIFLERIVERALAMEGTCTGEHGVGQGKMKYLEREHGAAALELMRSIKRSFDPLNIMNPGKMVVV